MATRCKPGDIAVITREVKGCEANVGRHVYVRGPDEINKQGKLTWLITPVDESQPWLVGDGKGGTYVMKVGDLTIEHPDAWMTPVGNTTGTKAGSVKAQSQSPNDSSFASVKQPAGAST